MMNNHTATLLTTIAFFALVFMLTAMSSMPRKIHADTQIQIDTPLPTQEIPSGVPASPPETLKARYNRVIASNLKKVYSISKAFGHPETMQAILMQESGGGISHPVGNLDSPIGKRSYGIMQVQVVAARSILSRYPGIFDQYFPHRKYSTVTDEEIIALLLMNDEANIHIAAQHFNLYYRLSNGDWHTAVAAYNMGIGNALKRENHGEYPYVVEVERRIQEVIKPFNRQHKLPLTVAG
jgi:hypothetical protein